MPERSMCPDCGSPLGAKAIKCRCGWASSSASGIASAPTLPSDGNGRYYNPCEAYGCPLAGTVSRNPGPGGGWMCFVHDAHRDGDLQAVTQRIRANRALYSRYADAIRGGDRKEQAEAYRLMIAACDPHAERDAGEDDIERMAA